jgi:hypothetical protein
MMWPRGSPISTDLPRAYAGASNTVTMYNWAHGQIQTIIDMAHLSSLRTEAASVAGQSILHLKRERSALSVRDGRPRFK